MILIDPKVVELSIFSALPHLFCPVVTEPKKAGLMTVWADILGRILIHGVDIPLGVSLSLIGAPVFLGMLIRRSYHFGGEGA